MKRTPARTLPALLATLVSFSLLACTDTGTAPDPEWDLDRAVSGLAGLEAPARGAHRSGPGTLHVLLRSALRSIAQTEGRDAARALLAPVAGELRLARGARQAGDHQAARGHLEAARRLQAEIILDELGSGVLDDLLVRGARVVEALDQHIAARQAAGADPTGLRAARDRAAGTLAEAEAARAAGDEVTALLVASRVVDVGRRMRARAAGGPPSAGARRS